MDLRAQDLDLRVQDLDLRAQDLDLRVQALRPYELVNFFYLECVNYVRKDYSSHYRRENYVQKW